jgi:hypothetical protein
MQGRGTDERINATAVVVGTGARPGCITVHLGITSDGPATESTQLAGRGGCAASDAIGSSGQMAPKLADMTLSESGKEWLVGGSCG